MERMDRSLSLFLSEYLAFFLLIQKQLLTELFRNSKVLSDKDFVNFSRHSLGDEYLGRDDAEHDFAFQMLEHVDCILPGVSF